MSFAFEPVDEVDLHPEWDFDLIDELENDFEPNLPFGFSDFEQKMRELFTCSQTVLEQSLNNLLIPLILCLIWRLLYLLLVLFTRTPGKFNRSPTIVLHTVSIVQGILVLYYFFENNTLILVQFIAVLALLFGLNEQLLAVPSYVGYNNASIAVILLCAVTQLYGEFQMNPQHWHQIRGSMMILIMKAISFSSDVRLACQPVKEPHVRPMLDSVVYRILAWMSYALCPATIVFGPWIEFSRFERLVSLPFEGTDVNQAEGSSCSSLYQFFRSIKHAFWSSMVALFALVWSTCVSYLLLSGIWRFQWLNAYVASQSFRFSHYFISYSSEALLAMFGMGYSLADEDPACITLTSGPVHVTRMLEVEFPRSLVNVVVNWNLSMHTWLKYYVYKPVRAHGHLYAILATYTVSSLLHGINFQLSAVLLSIGLFAYIEFVLREQLAIILDSCIGSRRCGVNCTHKNKNGFWIRCCNFSFAGLAVFHLAYLAVMFDTSEQQEHGYSMSHALQKWSDLGFLSHYVALATYLFYRYIL